MRAFSWTTETVRGASNATDEVGNCRRIMMTHPPSGAWKRAIGVGVSCMAVLSVAACKACTGGVSHGGEGRFVSNSATTAALVTSGLPFLRGVRGVAARGVAGVACSEALCETFVPSSLGQRPTTRWWRDD